MAWTDERIDKLKSLWGQGLTASQIADELTGVSRNAVIGKAHRLGLESRPSPVRGGDGVGADPEPVHPPVAAQPVLAPPVAVPSMTIPPVTAPAESAAAAEPVRLSPIEPVSDAAPAHGPAPRPLEAGSGVDPDDGEDEPSIAAAPVAEPVRDQTVYRSIGPGGFQRQQPGEQQAPIPPAPPRRLVPAKPAAEIAGKTSLLELNDRICKWPLGHPGEPDFHFCGVSVNPGFPYCVAHCGLAYQAQLPRRDRRPPPLPFGGPRAR